MIIIPSVKSAGIEPSDHFNAFFCFKNNELMTQRENHHYNFIQRYLNQSSTQKTKENRTLKLSSSLSRYVISSHLIRDQR